MVLLVHLVASDIIRIQAALAPVVQIIVTNVLIIQIVQNVPQVLAYIRNNATLLVLLQLLF